MSIFLRRALLPSLEILLFLLVFYISLFFMPDMLNSDGDLGRHITVGNYILDSGTIPDRDVFSHTRFDAPLVLHEWLSEVVYALANRAWGLNGAAWLTALLLAMTFFVLAVGLRWLGVSAPLAFLAALAAYFTGAIHHLPRPHLFTLLLFTIFILMLEGYRRSSATQQSRRTQVLLLAALGGVMVLWSNVSGAFVMAFSVSSIYIVGALFDREPHKAMFFGVCLIVAFGASLVNPYGITLIQHVFGFLGNRFLVDNTVEYLSPNFHNVSAWLFAAWILVSIVLFGRNTTRVSWTALFLLSAWTAFGLYSARNIANYAQVAAIVIAPVASLWLVEQMPRLKVRLSKLDAVAPIGAGWMWGIGVVALLVWLQANGAAFDARGEGNVFTTRAFPVGAVNYLEENPPQGKMFNEYTWGGYLEYRLFPSQRVFIDGDIDFFGDAFVREYLDVVNARGDWKETLNRYGVDWVIVPPERALAIELARSADWQEVYRDENAGVWVRRGE